MLNGIAPIMIFDFSKLSPSIQQSLSSVPIISSFADKILLPPIPVYLDPTLTGIHIDTEDKSIDIETSVDSKTDGTDPETRQKSLNSIVKITMLAQRDSIGLTLMSAIMDLIYPKVTSAEYSITYLNGAVTVFGGLLHSFNITQGGGTDKYTITIELAKTRDKTEKKAGPPEVTPTTEAVNLQQGVTPPTAPLRPPMIGPRPPAPLPVQPPIKMGLG